VCTCTAQEGIYYWSELKPSHALQISTTEELCMVTEGLPSGISRGCNRNTVVDVQEVMVEKLKLLNYEREFCRKK
jgi:hypothetical protein